ncbi:MAG: hypothetical protein J4432_00755 [DPANN group archaeon]|nr:hypothetical protein [DPANN group archaeon]
MWENRISGRVIDVGALSHSDSHEGGATILLAGLKSMLAIDRQNWQNLQDLVPGGGRDSAICALHDKGPEIEKAASDDRTVVLNPFIANIGKGQ